MIQHLPTDSILPLILLQLPCAHCILVHRTCRQLRDAAAEIIPLLRAARTIRRFWQWCARFASLQVLGTRFRILVREPIARLSAVRLICHLRSPGTVYTTRRLYEHMRFFVGADFASPRIILTASVLCCRPDILAQPFDPVEFRIVTSATRFICAIAEYVDVSSLAASHSDAYAEWEHAQNRPHALDVW